MDYRKNFIVEPGSKVRLDHVDPFFRPYDCPAMAPQTTQKGQHQNGEVRSNEGACR
jgi:hypothetical protein